MKDDLWFSYAGFKFKREQVKWGIYHLSSLRNGQWPPSHKESGYINAPIGKKGAKTEATFVKAASIAAELDWRIAKCGVDGLMLEFLYAFEPEDELFIIEHMAQCLNMEVKEVSRRIRNALYYVSGERRKKTSYSQYQRDNRSYLK